MIHLLGQFTNVTMGLTSSQDPRGISLPRYLYQTPIQGQSGSFKLDGQSTVYVEESRLFVENPWGHNKIQFMPAQQHHTMYVESGLEAAWLLIEGAEDPNYIPYSYSDANLATFAFTEHYGKLTSAETKEILDHLKIS